MVANSNAMQIPMGAKIVYSGMTEVDGEEVELKLADAKVGTAYTSVALNNASLNTNYAFSDVKYAVSGLPDGLTFNADTGIISGTPTKAGEYTVTVTASADGYRSASIDLAMRVTGADGTITNGGAQNTVDGLAIAGLVLGIVGVLAAGAAIALVLVKRK